jgi:UDP-2,3-diacylglucosamine hydrolase
MDYFIFGHRHIMLDLMLSRKSRIMILGDWITHFSYAVMDENGDMMLDQFEYGEYEEEKRDGVSIAIM